MPLSAVASREDRRRPADDPQRERAACRDGFTSTSRGRDLASVVRDLKAAVARDVKLPPGYSVAWSGQFEYLERAKARLKLVVPADAADIFVLLYLASSRIDEASCIMLAVPVRAGRRLLAAVRLGHAMSVASAVGFIGLAGVVRRIRHRHADLPAAGVGERGSPPRRRRPRRRSSTRSEEGAVLRVRPKAMTVAMILVGSAADHAVERHRRRDDAADRRTDGRRHDHRADAVDAGDPGGLPAAAAPRTRADDGASRASPEGAPRPCQRSPRRTPPR